MTTLRTSTLPDARNTSVDQPGSRLSREGLGVASGPRIIARRYRIDELLAEGGMALVYRGWHVPLDQPIAIKVLNDDYCDNLEAVARFLQEARAGARLRGKHVAHVLDIGRIDGGAPFMVTELLEGTDLGRLSETSGPLPIKQAVELLLAACEAIAETHESGIVHRDLKPDNLFLTRTLVDGRPLIKVLDFGIAKRLNAKEDLTETKCRLGSPHYMAPEQMVSPGTVDTRADIWSLGVVLFELLTADVPFDGPTIVSVCDAVVKGACPLPSQWRPDLPRELEEIILRCLQKRPAQRFATVLEMAEALRALLPQLAERGEPQRASEPDWFVEQTDWLDESDRVLICGKNADHLHHGDLDEHELALPMAPCSEPVTQPLQPESSSPESACREPDTAHRLPSSSSQRHVGNEPNAPMTALRAAHESALYSTRPGKISLLAAALGLGSLLLWITWAPARQLAVQQADSLFPAEEASEDGDLYIATARMQRWNDEQRTPPSIKPEPTALPTERAGAATPEPLVAPVTDPAKSTTSDAVPGPTVSPVIPEVVAVQPKLIQPTSNRAGKTQQSRYALSPYSPWQTRSPEHGQQLADKDLVNPYPDSK